MTDTTNRALPALPEHVTPDVALRGIMQIAESFKEPCGPDPESTAAIRNGKLATIRMMAAQGLGMMRGPWPERPASFVNWLAIKEPWPNGHWREETTMGEHDSALSAWRYQQAKIDRLRAAVAALLKCPSGNYCDAYPAAVELADAAMKASA